MLIEAYIHLGQFGRAKTLMNKGIATDYPEGKSDFTNWIAEGYTAGVWRAASGFRSTYSLDDRTFEESMSEEALKKMIFKFWMNIYWSLLQKVRIMLL